MTDKELKELKDRLWHSADVLVSAAYILEYFLNPHIKAYSKPLSKLYLCDSQGK